MTNRRPTLADVARRAGVAPSTASVVFSGTTPASPETKQRVLAAAEELGYTGPDPRAASLRRGRSGIVGVVIEERLGLAFVDPVTRLMMDGLADGVESIGAGLLLLRHLPDASASAGTVSPTDAAAPTLTTAPIDAVVLIDCDGSIRESLRTVLARGIPVVVIEGDAGPGIPQIQLDNRVAQARAAQHLYDLGHRRVAIVALPIDGSRRRAWLTAEDSVEVAVTADRLNGAHDVFADAPAFVVTGSSIDDGIAAGREIFADADARPTAVIAQSDLLAAGVIRAATEAGLRVPEDVSVTGFDGAVVDGLAPYELTTLVQPATAKGNAAGAAVAAMLRGDTPESVLLSSTFRVGNTTGPAPS